MRSVTELSRGVSPLRSGRDAGWISSICFEHAPRVRGNVVGTHPILLSGRGVLFSLMGDPGAAGRGRFLHRHGDDLVGRASLFVLFKGRNPHERLAGVGSVNGLALVSECLLGKALRVPCGLGPFGPGVTVAVQRYAGHADQLTAPDERLAPVGFLPDQRASLPSPASSALRWSPSCFCPFGP